MRKFVTQMNAIDRTDGEEKTFAGPIVKELTFGRAEDWCKENAPYLEVLGEFIQEIPCKDGTLEPDWDNIGKDFNAINNN